MRTQLASQHLDDIRSLDDKIKTVRTQISDLVETSGTGLFTYALAWGINQGLLDQAQYGPAVRRAWSALMASVQPDGKLTHVQPIGRAPGGFPEDATEVYGVGAFLLAGSEMVRMGLQARAPAQTVEVANPGAFYRSEETVELKRVRRLAVDIVTTAAVADK